MTNDAFRTHAAIATSAPTVRLLAFVATAALAVGAPAQSTTSTGSSPPREARHEHASRAADEADRNGDGRVEHSEKEALRAERVASIRALRTEVLARHDANRDGALGAEELAALSIDEKGKLFRAAFRLRQAEELLKHDLDDDGVLDLIERSEARAAGGDAMARLRAKVNSRFDLDHDGKLSETEERALQERRARLLRGVAGSRLRASDADGDGQLSAAEREAAWQRIEDWRKALDADVLARFDVNRDGKLDPAEKAAVRAAEPKPRGPAGP